ncbi:methylated-DNA--[protein]-cysteine S-methyltransferase [Krasilnikovia sp. MM14-A1004]|uniref:methylated-DNA--[protein]-cysteine S-methyltransferase n=1 Tax=Krasilnikovia sp. MM14-A1004 TaxID=3373541 RepID=UPI00399CDD09
MMRHSTMDTPAGPFTAVVSGDGAVRAAGFTADVAALMLLVHPDLAGETRPATDLGAVSAAVRRYLDGDLAALDDVAVEQRTGGAFMAHAWQVMREIKPGAPVTYALFAELAGRPAAVRAAAAACARNPVALFVPCHRVLRTDGTLGGYRWGLDVKTWLLEHERH